LLQKWDGNGPKLIWSREGIGKGYSSVIIVENTVFTTGIHENQDALIALDLNDNIKWKKPIGRSWEESFPESRSTPTYDSGKLYVVSGADDIACF
jgi:hypothetical protein